MQKSVVANFKKEIYRYYRAHRRSFLWRRTKNPYHILVSEIMLQQTQTSRVAEKYPAFIKQFPTVKALAVASPVSVLAVWSGLGYNRRAIFLKRAAQMTQEKFDGKIPASYEALRELPGVGQNTAAAILAFAYGIGVPFIETNIRSVFIHHFFAKKKGIPDKKILPLVAATLDTPDPRNWYYALMDYGVMLKEKYKNPSRRSKHHQKQSRFEGSHRQLRGSILKALLAGTKTEKQLVQIVGKGASKIRPILLELSKEKFIEKRAGAWRILTF